MLAAQLLAVVERLAPPDLAEDWDNVGLLVGRHNRRVSRVLVALDLRDDIVSEARELGCDAVLTHHPPIFPVLDRFTDDAVIPHLVLSLAELRIPLIAAHTNLDAAAGGLNDEMAALLGLTESRPLAPSPTNPSAGLGRVGAVPETTVERIAAHLTAELDGARPVCAGEPTQHVATVACCTGSGASLIDEARAAGADVYIASDLRYHDADRAQGMPLIDIPHGVIERAMLKRWSRRLERELAGEGVEVRFADTDTDPWHLV